VTRLTLGSLAATALLLPAGIAAAQPAPPAGVPAVAAPPPPAAPAVAGAATAVSGVTPTYVGKADFKPDARPEGWSPAVSLGVTAAFANNSSVVGQIDGSSFSFGMKGDAALDYNHGLHEWRNTLGVVASVTRTPVITDFVKTSDNLNLDSIYLFHALSWFGPFVQFSGNTSMFRGTDVRPTPMNYVITRTDGTTAYLTHANSLTLSDPFRPLTFKETIGLFAQPYVSTPFAFELRAGAGAQEVLADGQLAVTGTTPNGQAASAMLPLPPTPNTDDYVSVKQLSNANQLGPELAASIWGSFMEKRVTYKVNADVMTPAAHSALAPGDTRGAFALTNVQLDAKVSFHLVEWASIDYQFRALRQPQVVDVFQVQNTLLLTFGLSYGGKPAAPPPCTPCAAPAPAPAAPAATPPPAAPPPAQ
jgi:hypothetical protein